MSLRGRHLLSRMLVTFDPYGGSSKGMMQYLKQSGTSLKERVESLGGQLFVEVKPSHHPEVRICYVNGTHLNEVAKVLQKRHLAHTCEHKWRPDTTNRIRNRRRSFRMTESPPFVTRNPEEERRILASRLWDSDTAAGRERIASEIGAPPDLPDDRYSIHKMLTSMGSLKHDPKVGTQYDVKVNQRGYRWPAWKVWGPSGKIVNARNLTPKEIEQHIWWLTCTLGQRSSKWANNVARHTATRPSIQGKWDPYTAARLQHAEPFTFQELTWEDMPQFQSLQPREDDAMNALPFVSTPALLDSKMAVIDSSEPTVPEPMAVSSTESSSSREGSLEQ